MSQPASGRQIRLPKLPKLGDNADMQTEPPKADPPKRKRRWFQFSLRSLLIFTLICAVGCAWVVRRMERKRKEREAVETLVERGGRATYDYQDDGADPPGTDWLRELLGENFFSEVVDVNLCGNWHVTDAGLARLEALTELQTLNLVVTSVTDAGLVHVKALTNLKRLILGNTHVTDAGLVHVKGLTKLKELSLDNTEVTDAGLVNLRGLSHLQRLDLGGTQVTDAGLAHLKGLTELQILNLGPNLDVTDTGLANLKGLDKLDTLDLSLTKVTDAGVKDIQKSLPNCVIIH